MRRPYLDDVADVLAEIKRRYIFGRSSVSELRRDAIQIVAKHELSLQRFSSKDSAEKSIYDACSRRLGKIGISEFDQLAADWLHGQPGALTGILLERASTEDQRLRLAEVIAITDSQDAAIYSERANELESPRRVEINGTRILRDIRIATLVKALHNYECQICGYTIALPDGSRYAEGHHLWPLGSPHNGPDLMNNIICVCPNHHSECDFGVIPLDRKTLRIVAGHEIDQRSLDYHNLRIFRRP